MRSVVLILALVACGPKVSTSPSAFDEQLGKPIGAAAEASEGRRPEAAPGKGVRTGTIDRAHLIAVLDAGPAMFLRQLEVTARMSGKRFAGWQLVQLLDRQSPLFEIDLVPGDVLLAVNDQPLSRPDQLQIVWDSLRTANAVRAQLWRGDAKFELAFTIEPPVAPAPAQRPPAKQPPVQVK